MTSFKTLWECMFSPKLVKIYTNGPVEVKPQYCNTWFSLMINFLQKIYQPQTLERWGDQVLNSVRYGLSLFVII